LTVGQVIKKGVWGVAYVVVFGCVLELCARVDDWVRWRAPLWGHYSYALLQVQDAMGIHSRPNARFEKWRINAHGFRSPETTMAKPEGVVRVMVIGASETFGLYESPGKDYPTQMQEVLDVAAPGRYEVLNAGCAGMTTPRFVDYYPVWLAKFAPDIVVIYPSPSSYVEVDPPELGVPMRAGSPRHLPETLRLIGKTKIVLKRFVPARLQTRLREFLLARKTRERPPDWFWQEPPADRPEVYREHIAALIEAIRANGAPQIILATHATRFPEEREDWTDQDRMLMAAWRKFYPKALANCLLEMEERGNEVVFELGEQYGVSVVDLASAVPAQGEYFGDFAHFSDKGARKVANALVRQILRSPVPGEGH